MVFTEKELVDMGMTDLQIKSILAKQEKEMSEKNTGVQIYKHDVEIHTGIEEKPLTPTSLEQIASYKNGQIVELPPFADGQPFVARMTRPSMLALVKSGKIPNSLLNQATSLFANGSSALNSTGKNATNINELFDVIETIVGAALLEPTIEDIHSVGMELSDDQLMAIFSYTQNGVKALEQFRTERANTQYNSNVEVIS
ncbi:MAG: hypothetical protein K2N51_15060 [Lachnospiraceae bacterium]|nr:hypothetical protein [Lachnospiraceae bacterium]